MISWLFSGHPLPPHLADTTSSSSSFLDHKNGSGHDHFHRNVHHQVQRSSSPEKTSDDEDGEGPDEDGKGDPGDKNKIRKKKTRTVFSRSQVKIAFLGGIWSAIIHVTRVRYQGRIWWQGFPRLLKVIKTELNYQRIVFDQAWRA